MKNLKYFILIFLYLLIFAACSKPPIKETGGQGDIWLIYNQSYNHRSVASTDQYISFSSQNVIYEGSYLESKEKITCKGNRRMKDCQHKLLTETILEQEISDDN